MVELKKMNQRSWFAALAMIYLLTIVFPTAISAADETAKQGLPGKGDTFTNNPGMTFVYIPRGQFLMGGQGKAPGTISDEAPHKVKMSRGFFMQTTEVTQGQWEEVMGENPSFNNAGGKDCPVEQVSWDDAHEFLKKLNEIDTSHIYRLPTEAEWEYAARGGRESVQYAGGDDPDAVGWHRGNSDRESHPVGLKAPNGYGLYDMSGNVWELCQDWYGKNYYQISLLTDPRGPETGDQRVIRGGAFLESPGCCRTAFRYWIYHFFGYRTVGLRVAATPAQSQ